MKILDHLEEWIISLSLFAMTALAFMQVVRRYIFNTGFSWTLELTGVIFALMIFVGISYGVRVGSHIGVDALVNMLSPPKRRFVSIIAVLLSLACTGLGHLYAGAERRGLAFFLLSLMFVPAAAVAASGEPKLCNPSARCAT